MIRVACLLLVAARALSAAPAPAPTSSALAPGDLPARSLRDVKGIASSANPLSRKQFLVKLHCKDSEKCAQTLLYEFNLLRVQPSESGKRVYY
uniref:Uncharacterized protein n=1 Tax=Heliothis virescens TaxID=7102 RepID=A0A2A4IVW6_HELVI